MTKTAYEQVFDIVRSFEEGLTCFKLVQLIDKSSTVKQPSALLSQLVKAGLVVKRGYRSNPSTGYSGTVYVATGKQFSKRKQEQRSHTRKRHSPLSAEVKELRRLLSIADVRWAAALERFPDLAIEPALLAGRAKLAEIFRADGNETKAVLAERGKLDESETMHVALVLMLSQ